MCVSVCVGGGVSVLFPDWMRQGAETRQLCY